MAFSFKVRAQSRGGLCPVDLGPMSQPHTQLFLKNPAFLGKAHFIIFLTKPHQGSSRHTCEGCESLSSMTNVSLFPIQGKSKSPDHSRQLPVINQRTCTIKRRILQPTSSPTLGSGGGWLTAGPGCFLTCSLTPDTHFLGNF